MSRYCQVIGCDWSKWWWVWVMGQSGDSLVYTWWLVRLWVVIGQSYDCSGLINDWLEWWLVNGDWSSYLFRGFDLKVSHIYVHIWKKCPISFCSSFVSDYVSLVASIVCSRGGTLSLVMSRALKVLQHMISIKDGCLLAPLLETIRGFRPLKRVIIFYLGFPLRASLKTGFLCLTACSVVSRLVLQGCALPPSAVWKNKTLKKLSVNPLILHHSRPCQRRGSSFIYSGSLWTCERSSFCAFAKIQRC